MVKVAILGYGTVRSGVFEVLKKNQDMIADKMNDRISKKLTTLIGILCCFIFIESYPFFYFYHLYIYRLNKYLETCYYFT